MNDKKYGRWSEVESGWWREGWRGMEGMEIESVEVSGLVCSGNGSGSMIVSGGMDIRRSVSMGFVEATACYLKSLESCFGEG